MGTKTKLILCAALLLTFLAGGVVGTATWQGISRPHPDRRRLSDKLRLSEGQREQMREVWRGTFESRRSDRERRSVLAEQRDEAIAALIPDDRREAYDQTLQAYRDGLDELSAARAALVEQAIEKTKALLSPEQASKYEQMLKERGRHGSPFGRHSRRRGPGGRDRSKHDGASRDPATQQAPASGDKPREQ